MDNSEKTKAFFKEAVKHVIEDVHADETVIEKYFSKDYVQHVDGKTIDYKGFVAHMKAQKGVMQSVDVEFKHLVAEGNSICSVHLIHGVKKDGNTIEGQVIGYFEICDGKVVLCDELTHLIKGDESDRDLGSRH